MSSSSISLTPTPSTSSRRLPLDNPPPLLLGDPLFPNLQAHNQAQAQTQAQSQNTLLTKPQPPPRASNPARKPAKPVRPKAYTVARVLFKNLVLFMVLAGLVKIARRLIESNGAAKSEDGVVVIKGDLEAKFAELDSFVKKRNKGIQNHIEEIDRKLNKHVVDVKAEFKSKDLKFEKKLSEVRVELGKEFGERLRLESVLSRKEFERFVSEFSKGRGKKEGGDLDEMRVYVREVMEREMERHAADGMGRVDYALWSGGGRVVGHSEAYVRGLLSVMRVGSVSRDAEKMLIPSFGEPGKCFAVKGSSGFVVIRLRTAVVPEAFTLEHVDKSVAYDRSSAPKDCRISGWQARAEDYADMAAENEKMLLLSEYTYDLEERNAQTFKVIDSVGSTVVDTIRFDFTSNHGSASHTCIYRLRVHGYEPSLSMSAAEL